MLGDDYVKLRGFHDYVLVRSPRHLEQWLKHGFVLVPNERLFEAIHLAFDHFTPAGRYAEVWKRLFPHTPLPSGWIPQSVRLELVRVARGPIPRLSVTDAELPAPVAGLRLELLIADGEIKHAQTDANGIARVERIQAGRVVIRVLDLDGALWKPLEGDASQPSSSDDRPRMHIAQPGECLSKIALQRGLSGWKKIWDDPANEKLRNKRKSPHVLLPGDQVTVPSITVHEIIRPTDATHRIKVSRRLATFQVVLQDHNQLPFQDEPYELRIPGEQEPRRGNTGSDGRVKEQVPVHAARVDVRLPGPGLSWSFALSQLIAVPADNTEQRSEEGEPSRYAVKAAQARLNALGFPCGAVDGLLGPRTRAALALQCEGTAGEPDAREQLASASLSNLHTMFLA
jgi:hypothetical protein